MKTGLLSYLYHNSCRIVLTYSIALYAGIPCLMASVDHNNQPVYIFAHGMFDNKTQADPYLATPPAAVLAQPLTAVDFPDAFNKVLGIKIGPFWQFSFGQHNDIAALAKTYDNTIKKHPGKGVVLMGVSRGASAALSFTALQTLFQSETTPNTQIEALILESPFARVNNVIKGALDHIPALLKMVPGTRELAELVMYACARQYDPNANDTIDYLPYLPKNLPILILCSAKDTLVPATSSIAIYTKLKELGHPNVHLAILPTGRHARFYREHQESYLATVHAFYQKYKLPHDARLATLGKPLLEVY